MNAMPTYNYYCSQCDSNFSLFQKMSELSLKKCENCGGKIERVITGGTGLIFKGSGFYLTDYKDEKGMVKEIEKKDVGDLGKSKTDKEEAKSIKSANKSISKKVGI